MMKGKKEYEMKKRYLKLHWKIRKKENYIHTPMLEHLIHTVILKFISPKHMNLSHIVLWNNSPIFIIYMFKYMAQFLFRINDKWPLSNIPKYNIYCIIKFISLKYWIKTSPLALLYPLTQLKKLFVVVHRLNI